MQQQISSPFGFINKYGKYIIIICWLVAVAFYYKNFGLMTSLEAQKYIREAHLLLNTGRLSAPRFWFYSGTILIIAFALKIGTGLYGAFIIQAIINLGALLLFYQALKKIFYNPITALFVVVYLILFWPYQSWVVYLYTESVFFSMILILLSVLILYKPNNLKNIFVIFIALALVIISRPLGILFIISTYLYFFINANKKWKIVIACSSIIGIALALLVINIIFSTINDWTITEAFERENIICDAPTIIPSVKLNLATSGSPVYKLLFYISHNFSHFIHFAGIKLQYFFLMRRYYYSNAHNLFLLINIIPVYILAIIGLFKMQKKIAKSVIAFIVCTILLYTITIILQCDDYHNRFILSIYPLFVILAGLGAEQIMQLISKWLLFKNR
jgi:hypothetical protein